LRGIVYVQQHKDEAARVTDGEFFRKKRAPAVLKHGVLSRYLVPFTTKTSSAATGGRVVVLDGYAGSGRYDDGSAGSPIFIAAAARRLPPGRKAQLLFVEEKPARVAKLRQVLSAEAADIDWTVEKGTVEQYLDQALTIADGVPFFALLDPCGLGLTFEDIATKIYGRPHFQYSPGTEVCSSTSRLTRFAASVAEWSRSRKAQLVVKPRWRAWTRLAAATGGATRTGRRATTPRLSPL